jgi:hypothetical protein
MFLRFYMLPVSPGGACFSDEGPPDGKGGVPASPS